MGWRLLAKGLVILAVIAGVVVLTPLIILFVLMVTFLGWPHGPPSDDEMIALLTERRSAFEAMIAKVSEGRATGRITLSFMDSGADVGVWVEDLRQSMRAAGIGGVKYYGRDEPIIVYYDGWGSMNYAWYKDFVYRHTPLVPPPTVIDLHGNDNADVARAVLCYKDHRADLRHLCKSEPWVNDIDFLDRYDDGGDWIAERPIDEHWSLRLWHSR